MNNLLFISFNIFICLIMVIASSATKTTEANDDSSRIVLDRRQQLRSQQQHYHQHRRTILKPKEIVMSQNSTNDGSNFGLETSKGQFNSTRSLKLRRVHSPLSPAEKQEQATGGYNHRTRGAGTSYNSHRSVRNYATTRNGIGSSSSGGVSRNDWSYGGNGDSYNVRSLGGGQTYPVTASSVGKDDILRDVEHINANGIGLVKSEWMTPRTDTEFVMQPAITTKTTSTTENPFATNFIRNIAGASNDPKNLESRHICMQQRTIQMPVKTTEVYTRPIWKHVSTPCQPQTQMNQMCTRVELIHEPAYRDVIRHKATKQISYDCCPGWTRTKLSSACMKPVCTTNCRNGGTCVGPDTCSCPPGFSGRYCDNDINECQEEKPCDQLCLNTEGSYYCKCRDGFVLQSDKQSCKKIDNNDDDAFEARDLENEIDSNEEVTSRLHKIERTLANERIQSNELQKSLQATYHLVDSLKGRLTTLEKQQHDFSHLQSNVIATDSRTRKLESMISLLFKCRTSKGPYCP